eukprot:CAMPEP_0174741956 /NCGR_PEP_ID=MMETSP1094-20130205/77648_1 /TAXON_ID=156173 /ORGANISM="Chrysochromulina brevifilum, Strain UTEX LB 985" /LENGTH=246 /DNA_ID=CAMNT_0015945933 /DNA_START=57 /DNA_END=797 /DNA_ORIENTATION=-
MSRLNTPEARIKADAERMKRRELSRAVKAGGSPGPGSYDIRRNGLGGSAHVLAGSAAFRSKSDNRPSAVLRDMLAPGTYDAWDGKNISKPIKTYNKPSQVGRGEFLTKANRPEWWTHTDGPGPAGYYPKLLPTMQDGAKHGSSFASQTKRAQYIPRQHTPGAGEYDPREGIPHDHVTMGVAAFKGPGYRFKDPLELEYAVHRSPLSYGDVGQHNIAAVARRNRENAEKRSVAPFGCSSLRGGDLFA